MTVVHNGVPPAAGSRVLYVSRYRVIWEAVIASIDEANPWTVTLVVPELGTVHTVPYDPTGQPNSWHYKEE